MLSVGMHIYPHTSHQPNLTPTAAHSVPFHTQVAPSSDVARLAYDLFGAAPPRLVDPALVAAHMVPRDRHYAFATFNLTSHGISGQSSAGPHAACYGHLGATCAAAASRTVGARIVGAHERTRVHDR